MLSTPKALRALKDYLFLLEIVPFWETSIYCFQRGSANLRLRRILLAK